MAVGKRFDVPIEGLLRRRVTGGLIVAVLLTVFLSFVSWRSARRGERDAYWVSHTHEMLARRDPGRAQVFASALCTVEFGLPQLAKARGERLDIV
jgi:hypothetical protein